MVVAIVAILAIVTAWGGPGVAPAYGQLGLAVLLTVRAPWSSVGYAAVLAAAAAVATTSGSADLLVLTVLRVALALAPFALIRLIAAIRALEAARESLAEAAVLQVRERIDDELRRTVGVELTKIVDSGETAAEPDQNPAAVEARLGTLVGHARRTLADARRLIRGYQRPSLRTELDTAATLLRAAGIATRVEAPKGEIPAVSQDELRAALQATTARLLRVRDVQQCVITLTQDGTLAVKVNNTPAAELAT